MKILSDKKEFVVIDYLRRKNNMSILIYIAACLVVFCIIASSSFWFDEIFEIIYKWCKRRGNHK